VKGKVFAVICAALLTACSHTQRTSDTYDSALKCEEAKSQTEYFPTGSHRRGGKCTPSIADKSARFVANIATDKASTAGVAVAVSPELRFIELGLDYRGVKRNIAGNDNSYPSFAGTASIHFGLLGFWPNLYRYVDVGPELGGSLGAIKRDREIRGRADWWYGAYVELTAPDVGSWRFTERGVPGLHIGIRKMDFVQEWRSTLVIDVGLTWRLGKTEWIHSYDHYRMMLD
jgi:hypothetical protein